MSDEVSAQVGEGSPIVEVPAGSNQSGSVRDAARVLAQFRHKQREPEANTEAPERPAATAQPESGEQPEPATAEAQPSGEQTEAADTPSEAPIDPPKSWTKEAKERFASLPRDTQEYLAQREDERDRDISRRQSEAAEKLKGLTAKEQQVEQARQQYETALPALLQTLQDQQSGEFHDIKTMQDVENLARTDWPRYVLWDATQKRIAAVQQQVVAATERQATEKQQKLSAFEQEQAKLFAEKVPEFADPKKKAELQNEAIALLKDHLGFSDQELSDIYNADRGLSLRDHRTQLLLLDGIKYRAAQASAKKITSNAKPIPPVQRPGVSQPRGAAQHALVENLTKRLDQSGSVKDAVRLIQERRKAG